MSANSQVSERIRQRREQLKWFRSVISEESGVPYARYCSIERGEVQITVDDLFKIAPALETTPSELLAGVFE
jgi:transcriptional regulator with XRE-family HTH domain